MATLLTLQELRNRQSWSLEQKVDHALGAIEKMANENNNKLYVAFSGGRDSTVLLHIARMLYKEIPAVFVNTTNENALILKFVKKTENVTILNPKITFIDVLKNNGFPLFSKEVCKKINDILKGSNANTINHHYQKNSIGALSEKYHKIIASNIPLYSGCCKTLKKDPLQKYQRENKRGALVGTMASESLRREKSYLRTSCVNLKANRAMPISIFLEKDITNYIKKYNVEISEIYKEEKRTGCAYCAFGIQFDKNKFLRLKEREPKRYEIVMNTINTSSGLCYYDVLKRFKIPC